MQMVLMTATGVGGATVLGAIIGFLFKKISAKFSDTILGFAAGVMLAAAVIGLILPSIQGGENAILVTVVGIFCGAVALNIIDRIVPHMHNFFRDGKEEKHTELNSRINKVILFVLAIAIHNLPEGIAAGVGFGSGDTVGALVTAGGIALQNLPEGMVIIAPILSLGISKKKAFLIAAATGLVEVIGTMIGYFAAILSVAILPFALSFAGGTMLYIISDEMIPETHAHGNERAATYALLVGFCLMMALDFYL